MNSKIQELFDISMPLKRMYDLETCKPTKHNWQWENTLGIARHCTICHLYQNKNDVNMFFNNHRDLIPQWASKKT